MSEDVKPNIYNLLDRTLNKYVELESEKVDSDELNKMKTAILRRYKKRIKRST